MTLVIYREVYGVSYVGMLNFASVFVLLGIGADDMFVLMDAFKQVHTILLS